MYYYSEVMTETVPLSWNQRVWVSLICSSHRMTLGKSLPCLCSHPVSDLRPYRCSTYASPCFQVLSSAGTSWQGLNCECKIDLLH